MEKELYNEIFDFKIRNNMKIAISSNELYNQMLLYIFFSINKNIVIVTPTLNEANRLYNDINSYVSNVFIFPEDDYLTKKAIAVSPELLFLRMKFLNSMNLPQKKILVAHTNSFLKKMPNSKYFNSKKIKVEVNKAYDRNELISKLNEIGYKRESIVTNPTEYAIRGMVIDVYPLGKNHPIRIDFFGDDVENIRLFDEITQRSIEEIKTVTIEPAIDEFSDSDSCIIDYMNEPLVIYQDILQSQNVQNTIFEQIQYYDGNPNSYFRLENLKSNNVLFVDTLNNEGKYDLSFNAESIVNYNNDFDKFILDVKKNDGLVFSNNKNFLEKIKQIDNTIKTENELLNKGFVYNHKYYYSENDIYIQQYKGIFESNYKLGKKINTIDKLNVGDYIVHKKNGVGIYMGITTILKNGVKKDYILIKYAGNDKLYLPVEEVGRLYKYSSREGAKPKINKLNSVEWQKTKLKIKNNIKSITEELLKIYKQRSVASVEAFLPDDETQLLFENEFEYEETPDQIKVINEIKRDLESTKPMDRLLCGDVGYGKTEVIFRAIYKTIINNKQVMYLCPTTLLSSQQFNSAISRFKNFSVNIALINRHTTLKELSNIVERLKNGKIDVVFGTHRLLSPDIKFKDLGLLIIDEEQRFGVVHKEKIKKIKSNVHVLSVSATPIPRSLQMSLIGIRDLSLIETAPKNRYPVQTYVINYDKNILREVVLKEKTRNGQVFILYNKIEDMEKVVNNLKSLIPETKIGYAHGKMNKYEIQEIMYEFTEKKYDVLVSTTIIENGIDIPNANTMIVMDADRFGLSQLYQIRGRVGRGDRIAYAYLLYDKQKILTETAIKRLEAIKEFTELGSGYKISMRDLSIRGSGDILGREQAGFIDSVGVDMYLDLINEEINNNEEEQTNDINLDDIETHINNLYSTEDEIIILLHKKISEIKKYEDYQNVYNEIVDRFGKVDEKLNLYMYQELLENIINELEIKIIENTNMKVTIKLDERIYNKLNIEKLFIRATNINTKFMFVYRGSSIFISLIKNNLEKSYLYYLYELINYVCNEIKTTI